MVCSPCQLLDALPVAVYQCLFLGSIPALDLPLACQCFLTGSEWLRKYQCHGPAVVCVSAQFAGVVLSDAFFQVVCMAGVIRVVGATQDVGPEGHGGVLWLWVG